MFSPETYRSKLVIGLQEHVLSKY